MEDQYATASTLPQREPVLIALGGTLMLAGLGFIAVIVGFFMNVVNTPQDVILLNYIADMAGDTQDGFAFKLSGIAENGKEFSVQSNAATGWLAFTMMAILAFGVLSSIARTLLGGGISLLVAGMGMNAKTLDHIVTSVRRTRP